MITVYPQKKAKLLDPEAESTMQLLQEVTVAIRNLRSTYGVPPQKGVEAELRASDRRQAANPRVPSSGRRAGRAGDSENHRIG